MGEERGVGIDVGGGPTVASTTGPSTRTVQKRNVVCLLASLNSIDGRRAVALTTASMSLKVDPVRETSACKYVSAKARCS